MTPSGVVDGPNLRGDVAVVQSAGASCRSRSCVAPARSCQAWSGLALVSARGGGRASSPSSTGAQGGRAVVACDRLLARAGLPREQPRPMRAGRAAPGRGPSSPSCSAWRARSHRSPRRPPARGLPSVTSSQRQTKERPAPPARERRGCGRRQLSRPRRLPTARAPAGSSPGDEDRAPGVVGDPSARLGEQRGRRLAAGAGRRAGRSRDGVRRSSTAREPTAASELRSDARRPSRCAGRRRRRGSTPGALELGGGLEAAVVGGDDDGPLARAGATIRRPGGARPRAASRRRGRSPGRRAAARSRRWRRRSCRRGRGRARRRARRARGRPRRRRAPARGRAPRSRPPRSAAPRSSTSSTSAPRGGLARRRGASGATAADDQDVDAAVLAVVPARVRRRRPDPTEAGQRCASNRS